MDSRVKDFFPIEIPTVASEVFALGIMLKKFALHDKKMIEPLSLWMTHKCPEKRPCLNAVIQTLTIRSSHFAKNKAAEAAVVDTKYQPYQRQTVFGGNIKVLQAVNSQFQQQCYIQFSGNKLT